MDLSFRAIHSVVHPTAAFSQPEDDANRSIQGDECSGGDDDGDDGNCCDGLGDGDTWNHSQLNPKNRIDSLEPLSRPLWRIDGSAGFGTQYYAHPLFLTNLPPMHIDVFIHEGASYPPTLRALLDLDKAFHIKDAARVRRLGVAQYILRILQRHTTHPNGALHGDVVRDLYHRGPLGSRIVIENLSCHIHEASIVVSRNYPLEADLLSYRQLVQMWGLEERKDSLPPEVDIANVRLVRQLFDSICEVYIDEGGGDDDDDNGDDDDDDKGHGHHRRHHHERGPVVLKSLASSVKYMYHELRAVLKDIPPHEHVALKPLHIVTKQCLFGGKRGVVGFTMPYYPTGSLRDILPMLRIHGRLALADQLRWSIQVTRAMCHVWHQGHSFYPDLRLDNIVLTAPAPEGDAVMVDFEQRGVWCSFSAPEVDFLENLRILACDDPENELSVPEAVYEKYKQELVECYMAAKAADGRDGHHGHHGIKGKNGKQPRNNNPSWWSTFGCLEEETKYKNPKLGYNVPWICLTKGEREAAMVYMLGRLLWCIFEGVSAPHRGAVWQSYPREPEVEFPHYRRTPPAVQALITRCFGDAGAREQSKFMRRASKLYMKADCDVKGESDHHGKNAGIHGRTSSSSGGGGGAEYKLVSEDLEAKARRFWRKRLEEGETWLRERNRRLLHTYRNSSTRVSSNDSNDEDDSNGTNDSNDDNDSNGSNKSDTTGSAFGRPTLRQVLEWLESLNKASETSEL
ncbi:Protein kinase-like domain protein [Niveomyces insectorum RCEF 264]|uniref:Protein kinase-like domain protein n=1 Tax=Niveomyces insectorum RCEF 264 TaxID=1081102 RepID=A0A168AAR5_9HYPO|nr:Protein kinase-like domain protein [Niveomyces insectorum RCEF 264]